MTPEEALRHAYAADVARLPPYLQKMYPVDRLVADHLANKPDARFFEEIALGDPRYEPQNDDERARQDALLQGYTGTAWTPSQVKALGREPEPYEFSPGAQYLDQYSQRVALYNAMLDDAEPKKGWFGLPAISSASWAGGVIPGQQGQAGPDHRRVGAAKLYADTLGRTHAYIPGTQIPEGGLQQFGNPENFIGTFQNKMSPVNSDAASQIGTALLRGDSHQLASDVARMQGFNVDRFNKKWGAHMDEKRGVPINRGSGESALEGFGNAAVRSGGSDWNRTSPQLVEEPADWREADRLVRSNRDAWANTAGLTAGDTWRSILEPMGVPNGRIPYVQPLLNAGLSFANGMADGSGAFSATKVPKVVAGAAAAGAAKSGVPGVSWLGRSTIADMQRHAKAYPTYARRFGYQTKDEAFDPGNIIGTGIELATPPREETTEEFQARMREMDQRRKQGMAVLERDAHKIKRPEPYGIEGAIRRGSKSLFGGLFGN